jgi:hypothetical protein
MRAQKHVVLPDEDALEFAELQAALLEELAPVGALQTVLARRGAIAAWRLARADRIETELFAEHRWDGGDLGLALIRDGNGTRSFETLMRYRGAAMAEFLRALRTLQALQAQRRPTAAILPAPPRHPNEPKRTRTNNGLNAANPSLAAARLARGPRGGAHLYPERGDLSGPTFDPSPFSRLPGSPASTERTRESAG